MARRLSKREKRLVLVLAALAALGVGGLSLAPREPPGVEDVLAYYVDSFSRADQITIRSAQSDTDPVILTRDEAPGFFSQLSTLARYGIPSTSPTPYPPKWILDLELPDGSHIKDISVGHHLDAPKQPARGQIWVIPNTPSSGEFRPLMVEAIDRYLDDLKEEKPQETSD